MKYVCLGYIAPGKFENMPEAERDAAVDECFAYDDALRKNGHFAGGEGLQPPQTAVTLRHQGGKVVVTIDQTTGKPTFSFSAGPPVALLPPPGSDDDEEEKLAEVV